MWGYILLALLVFLILLICANVILSHVKKKKVAKQKKGDKT